MIDPTVGPHKQETRDNLSAFQNGESFSYLMYPPGCPAAPTDGWAFATLGEVVNTFAGRGPLRDPRFRLLELRNHLAHCHYVGWAAVAEVVALRAVLGA